MSFGGFNAMATSNSDIDYVSGQLHAAYLMSNGNWYAKPLVDAGVTELYLSGFTESGGGGAGLTVPSRTDAVFNVSPALEIGTELRFDNVSVWRPFIRGGATWQNTDNFVLDTDFIDAPQGVSPFTISTKVDQVLADVAAGVDVIYTPGAVLRIQYDGKFAQDTQLNSVSLKGSVPF
jgi:outer membrane autotransporter protein